MTKIAVYGRWGSSAVRLYVREANRGVLFAGLAKFVSQSLLDTQGFKGRTDLQTAHLDRTAEPTHAPHPFHPAATATTGATKAKRRRGQELLLRAGLRRRGVSEGMG